MDEVTFGAFEVGASYVEVGTRQLACVNFALEVEVGVGLHASRGAHRGDAAGEIQARSGERHLRHQERRFGLPLAIQVWSRDIEEMIVHADDTRHYRVSAEVENRRASGCCNVCTLLDC